MRARRLIAVGLIAGCVGPGDLAMTLGEDLTGDPCIAMGTSRDTPRALADRGVTESSIVLAAIPAGDRIENVVVTVDVSHPYARDLDLFLVSPSGTTLTLSSDNGEGSGAGYRGTTFDDAAPRGIALAGDQLKGRWQPEEPLARLRGEPASGRWILRVADDSAGDTGKLVAWSIAVDVCPPRDCAGTTTKAELLLDVVAVPAIQTGWLRGVVNATAGATVHRARVRFSALHPIASQIDAYLQSPAGTRVALTSDNGSTGNDYTNTVFDDRAATSITAASPPFTGSFAPEEPLSSLAGEPAAGRWSLRYQDDVADQYLGIPQTAVVEVELCEVRCPVGTRAVLASAGAWLAVPDRGSAAQTIAVVDPGTVSRVAVRIHVSHAATGQLTIRLRSPASTRVALASRRGGDGDDYFGTLFTDEAALSVTKASPPFDARLRPEQPLSNLIGEPASGTWTVEVADEVAGVTGYFPKAEVFLCLAP